MVPRLTGLRSHRPRRRTLSRGLSLWSPCSAIKCLEERTLLSASLALYNGTYQGTVSVNNNGTVTTTTVNPTAFKAANTDGTIADTFATGSGLSNGTGTINVPGKINGSATYTQNGLAISVTDTSQATRSLSGVVESGTWTFITNLAGGVTETGSGTWTAQSVLSFNGTYAGSFNGSTTVNNKGSTTTTSIPNEVSNLSVSMTISNGAVTVSAPGVPSTGTGTLDQNGNITGTFTFTENGVPITGQFTGQVVVTPNGKIVTGAWSFSENFGNGVVYSGSGSWTANSPPTL